MGDLSITTATLSNMTGKVANVTIPSRETDGATGTEETEWVNTKFSQYWGYFNSLPELKSAIIMKAIWNVGKGYETDAVTQGILDNIYGWGKDTFDDILFNMEVIKRVGGDAFAEITRNDKNLITNIKSLDPSTIKIIVDKKGIIKRYEQMNKSDSKKLVATFQPEDILHLSNNRLADQIHGISDIEALEATILADNENFLDMKQIMHHQARPIIMFKLGTDDQTKINQFADKMDKAVNKGENIYIPDDKNAVSFEVVTVPISQIILEWRNDLKNRFYRAIGLPIVIFGQAGSTESGSKMEVYAHEQVWGKDQRYLEKQIWNQLQLKIKLVSPESLLNNLQTDNTHDGSQNMMNLQPQDLTAGKG